MPAKSRKQFRFIRPDATTDMIASANVTFEKLGQ